MPPSLTITLLAFPSTVIGICFSCSAVIIFAVSCLSLGKIKHSASPPVLVKVYFFKGSWKYTFTSGNCSFHQSFIFFSPIMQYLFNDTIHQFLRQMIKSLQMLLHVLISHK